MQARYPLELDAARGGRPLITVSGANGSRVRPLTIGRHRLVLLPEEEYAMSGGLHGDPQAEGYGAIDVEDIDPEARSRTL